MEENKKEIGATEIGNALLPLVRFGYNEALKDTEKFLSENALCSNDLVCDFIDFKLEQEQTSKEVDIYKLMDLFVNPYQYDTVRIPQDKISENANWKERAWFFELCKQARTHETYKEIVGKNTLDFEDWRNYYEGGYEPEQAITEDLTYAN